MEKVRYLERTSDEFRHRLANGSIRDVEVFSNRINIAGHIVLYSIIHDIIERKQAEEQLTRIAKRDHHIAEMYQKNSYCPLIFQYSL